MFKEMGNIASMLRQAQQMGSRMNEINAQLKEQRTSGSSGGGMVEVQVNGLGEVLKVSIDPTLVEKGDREMIEDLLPAAMNQAAAKAKQLHVEAMKSMTGGMNIPGLDDALSQFTGGGTPNS